MLNDDAATCVCDGCLLVCWLASLLACLLAFAAYRQPYNKQSRRRVGARTPLIVTTATAAAVATATAATTAA